MGGRASMIRRVYPKQFNTSLGVALVYKAPGAAAATLSSDEDHDAPLVTLTVWQMRSAYKWQ